VGEVNEEHDQDTEEMVLEIRRAPEIYMKVRKLLFIAVEGIEVLENHTGLHLVNLICWEELYRRNWRTL